MTKSKDAYPSIDVDESPSNSPEVRKLKSAAAEIDLLTSELDAMGSGSAVGSSDEAVLRRSLLVQLGDAKRTRDRLHGATRTKIRLMWIDKTITALLRLVADDHNALGTIDIVDKQAIAGNGFSAIRVDMPIAESYAAESLRQEVRYISESESVGLPRSVVMAARRSRRGAALERREDRLIVSNPSTDVVYGGDQSGHLVTDGNKYPRLAFPRDVLTKNLDNDSPPLHTICVNTGLMRDLFQTLDEIGMSPDGRVQMEFRGRHKAILIRGTVADGSESRRVTAALMPMVDSSTSGRHPAWMEDINQAIVWIGAAVEANTDPDPSNPLRADWKARYKKHIAAISRFVASWRKLHDNS